MTRQINETACDTVDGKNTAASLISALLCCGSPSAILRLVVAVIVFAFKPKSVWLLPHIREEIIKQPPSFTNSDPSPTIIFEGPAFGIVTPLEHVLPSRESWRTMALSCVSVSNFPGEATARTCVSDFEFCKADTQFSSAFTFTKHVSNRLAGRESSIWQFGDNFQPSKSLADVGFSGRHNVDNSNVVFSGGRPATTGAHCDILSCGKESCN
jgi:hypothetical protein